MLHKYASLIVDTTLHSEKQQIRHSRNQHSDHSIERIISIIFMALSRHLINITIKGIFVYVLRRRAIQPGNPLLSTNINYANVLACTNGAFSLSQCTSVQSIVSVVAAEAFNVLQAVAIFGGVNSDEDLHDVAVWQPHSSHANPSLIRSESEILIQKPEGLPMSLAETIEPPFCTAPGSGGGPIPELPTALSQPATAQDVHMVQPVNFEIPLPGTGSSLSSMQKPVTGPVDPPVQISNPGTHESATLQ